MMNSTNCLTRISSIRRVHATLVAAAALAGWLWLGWTTALQACPFCSAVKTTFSEQIGSSDIVVIARLNSKPDAADKTELPRAEFEIESFLKGEEHVTDLTFEAVVVDRTIEIGQRFLVMGTGVDTINWTTPMEVNDEVVEYLKQLRKLPDEGPERLAFFIDYFEHDESVLAFDAYDEFARAPYEDVKKLADKLDREQLIDWLEDPDVMKSRKRLYYTLLGVCGTDEDIKFLEEVIQSGDRDRQSGLDALIGCYLTLTGDKGVPLIEDTFLKNPDAEYIDVFSAITALRFHGTEADKVSQSRIVEALRYVLDRPKMADMVIPDLARWEDWSVMDRLVKMFKECDTDETRWVRTPIISYLQACPLEQADEYIAELREIDPDAAKRADMLAELDWGDEEDDGWGDEEDSSDEADSGDKSEQDPEANKGSDTGKKKSGRSGGGTGGGATDDRQEDGTSDEKVASGGESGNSRRELTVHPASSRYVSTAGTPSSTGDSSMPTPNKGMQRHPPSRQVAGRSLAAPPVASLETSAPATWVMVLGTLTICGVLFVLLWSVLNGTFERLMF